ncbi:UBA-like superfamily [Arabidopsis suecica]|uniref:UBA-like superfamily n=1 Tax=Arabidopsis suecica TaxID=45249 RepID=A0A8T2CJG5_ARASU|nr:UBA-like superfamily [Arabidopsis suecica]
MVTGSRSNAIGIDEKTRKMIHLMKEIVGNHSDADILVALKETNMDADEAVHKLIYQDPFHEVKRKKDKKKEEAIFVKPTERRKPFENISREVNSRTQGENNVWGGTNNQNAFPRNAASRHSFPKNPATGPSREFRVVRDNRSNVNANKELKHTSAHFSGSNISGEVAIGNKKGSSGSSGDYHSYGTHSYNSTTYTRSRQTGNVPSRRSTRKELSEGSDSVLGVYSSSADPVHVPSPDSRSSAAGAIRCEVRGVGFDGKPFFKDSSTAGSLAGSLIRKDTAYRPFSPISKTDQGNQTYARESVSPNHRSVSNSQHGNRSYQYVRTQQQAGVLSTGSQNKQWKPKSNQKSIGDNPGVIGTPKKPHAPPASVNSESEIVKLQDKISHASISESRNRCQLTFGSFVLEFDPSVNSVSGFEKVLCSSQELKHGDSDDSLPASPSKASTNGASGTRTVGTFDIEVRTSGAGSPPPVLMASEQLLSEQKEVPRSQNLDEYAQTELLSGNSPYTALEPKQQQDPLELHNFSDYDPQGGYDLPYLRQAMDENVRGQGLPSPQEQSLNPHMFNNAPASTIPMLQQPQAPMAQMYPQVHVSHFPNGMPYRQFLSPVYVPQMPMQGYSSNPAAYAHPSNGNSYVLMPGGSSHPSANGLKYGIQPFKQVSTGGPTGFGTFNKPNVVGNAPGYEDSSRTKYKDVNVYVPNPQAETSEIWMQNPRDLSGLQSPPYYNMAGQTPHGAYLSSFNSAPVQSSHMQFQGVFHSPQPGPMANAHHMGLGLGGNAGLGVAPSPSPVQVGAYQQPQLGHLNWPANF